MSESVTVLISPSKCSQRSNDSSSAAVGSSAANGSAVGGGFATTPNTAGNTKKVVTVSPLSTSLVMKVTFIESLPNASHLFLTPLAESALAATDNNNDLTGSQDDEEEEQDMFHATNAVETNK